ncbi:MAG: aspartyl/asparaginyl beta-hydroxylase domain-containing protein [Xanthomonadaceae bacterium]|nr:aspartyl/asparaginyl beta-hydroxylase domain-containing protein [Xanthomonadaceae bacterium]MDE1958714.1 aspartyl/asparaginyl beta-hydroxylase domain-containing protein [Xanthomonadaceae bacterium]MDE2245698.1 aspartyl/asparaginyl beta-hydroxylase domain-containing protein [Xanthomonadaceae bacterium]
MSAAPTQPLDKDTLIGACTRLKLVLNLPGLQREVAELPAEYWGTRGGRVGVHSAAEAIFLRGYAPADGETPIEDRQTLERMPRIRALIHTLIPAPPKRCLLARLNPGATIAPHIDRADYFSHTIRIHVPICTDPAVLMVCRGRAFHMREGEVWALNNSNQHAVLHDGTQARTHLICDFLPTPELEALILAGDRSLDVDVPDLAVRLDRLALRSSAAR